MSAASPVDDQPSIVPISDRHYRDVLSQYPTGVAVITSTDEHDSPIGMTVGTFTSVSLEPPLIGFLPAQSSSTWPSIQRQGHFAVNILASGQETVCRSMAGPSEDRFKVIDWTLSPRGNPVLAGALAWIECELEDVLPAGDHAFVLGRVTQMRVTSPEMPLLFFRGGYGSFGSRSLAVSAPEFVDQFKLIDSVRPALDQMAGERETEARLLLVYDQDVVIAAASGRNKYGLPARIGHRVPMIAPLGAVMVAWADEAAVQRWLGHAGVDRTRARALLAQIRTRGYAVGLGHENTLSLERSVAEAASTYASDQAVREALQRRVVELVQMTAGDIEPDAAYECRFVTAPVRDVSGKVVAAMTLGGPEGLCSGEEIHQLGRYLTGMAATVSEDLGYLS